MAVRWAIANGNWSNASTWSGSIIPTSADNVYPNNFTVTVDQNITVLNLNNGNPGIVNGPVAGGTFALANGITVTVTSPPGLTPATGTLTRITGSDTVTINGAVGPGLSGVALLVSQSANAIISGSVQGGTASGNAITHASSGTLTITGSVRGNSGTNTHGITLSSSGSINILGSVTGGTSFTAHGINSTSTGVITITGSITGGTSTGTGVNLTSTGTLLASGSVQAGIGTSGVISSAASTIQIIGPISSSTSVVGVPSPGIQSTSATATNLFTGPFYNTNNRNAVYAVNLQLISGSTPTWTFDTETYGEQRTLYTQNYPGNFPATTNVRQGVVFGDTGQFTGVVAVPSASNVLKGIPVGNTTGSASFDTQSVWSVATGSLTATGSIGERLKNASTVATDASLITSKGNL